VFTACQFTDRASRNSEQRGILVEPVSVILPTYNRAHLLGRAIDSVLKQTYSEFELVVLDDGSTDNTKELVQSYKDSRVLYFGEIKCGSAAAAYNAGVKKASHALIAFQDSDDEWVETKLEKQMKAFSDGGPEVGLVYCDMMRILDDGREFYFCSPVVDSDLLVDPATREYAAANIGSQTCLLRKDLFIDAGLFNETLPALEDLEFLIRLSRRVRFVKVAEPLVRYYETEGLMSNHTIHAKARSMLLKMYGKELSSQKWFVAEELAKINELKRLGEQAGTAVTSGSAS